MWWFWCQKLNLFAHWYKWNFRALGEIEKNSRAVLLCQVKEYTVASCALRTVYSNPGGFDEEFYNNDSKVGTGWRCEQSLHCLNLNSGSVQFSSVQSLSCVRLFATTWTAAYQASLFITNSQSPPKPMSIESMIPSNHLILCCPLLLLPSILPSIRIFSNESALHIRWPKYWSFSFTLVLPMNIQDWFPLGLTGWVSLQSKGLSRVFSNTTVQKHQFFNAQLSL